MKKSLIVVLIWVLCEIPLLSAPSVVFSGEISSGTKLFLLELENAKLTQLTQGNSSEFHPSLSSDGHTLAFVSDKEGAKSLYSMDLASPATSWKNLSAGMGAYSHPSFSPDGALIAVSYSPDPESPLLNAKLVILDPLNKTQTDLITGASLREGGEEEVVMVVDRPHWIDMENIVFVGVEYSDLEIPRMTSATIYRVNLKDKKSQRLVGGESYFDESGAKKGYMASLPWVCGSGITYAAIEGHVTRTPMIMTCDGKEKKVVGLNDPDFLGPLIQFGDKYLYGIQDQNGKTGLALQSKIIDSPHPSPLESRKVLPFEGSVLDPILMP